jgi:hypothetical protein
MEMLQQVSTVEQEPRMEGRMMSIILAPRRQPTQRPADAEAANAPAPAAVEPGTTA